MMNILEHLRQELHEKSDATLASFHQSYFKTGPGEYGEGDKFLGVKVPETRKLAKKYSELDFQQLESLIKSSIHEERLLALFILIKKYDKAIDESQKTDIYHFYIVHIEFINNWDLVDQSAPSLVGRYLFDKDRSILKNWTTSTNLWKRRIAVLSTYYFIQHRQFEDTLEISLLLLNDSNDLIHKALGWMLREIGKRDLNVEETFLKRYYRTMDRTTLRYAIEKFEEKKRQSYLKGEITVEC